jgi:hypothetical protein
LSWRRQSSAASRIHAPPPSFAARGAIKGDVCWPDAIHRTPVGVAAFCHAYLPHIPQLNSITRDFSPSRSEFTTNGACVLVGRCDFGVQGTQRVHPNQKLENIVQISGILIRSVRLASVLIPLLAAAATVRAAEPFVVTASNATANQLLVYSPNGKLLQTLSTKGTGGATGNAGGVQSRDGLVAVVNFGSKSVSIFHVSNNGLELSQVVPTVANPVSVAFGGNHLYVLGHEQVESHPIFVNFVGGPDGVSNLSVADGSAAQVGFLNNQIVVTEKSNVIETFNLRPDGAVGGNATQVQGVPPAIGSPSANEPFGLVTRGNDAYVTIAHLNELALVRNDAIISSGSTNPENAPCWATLTGPFLYTSNTASMNLSRFVVYGQHIVLDQAIAATFTGNPTDNASGEGLVAAIDGVAGSNPVLSHLSIFNRDEDGNLTPSAVIPIPGTINGVAVVPSRF